MGPKDRWLRAFVVMEHAIHHHRRIWLRLFDGRKSSEAVLSPEAGRLLTRMTQLTVLIARTARISGEVK